MTELGSSFFQHNYLAYVSKEIRITLQPQKTPELEWNGLTSHFLLSQVK